MTPADPAAPAPVRSKSAEQTRALGAALARVLRPGDVVVLAGDLGTGKTTFAQGVARGLGVTDPVTSPTFAIVHEYETLVHVDVYRLDHVQELHDLGFDELIDDGRVTLVEWGDAIGRALPRDHLVVRIELVDDPDSQDARVFTFEARGAGWQGRRAGLPSAVT